MKITSSSLRDFEVIIALDETERFRIDFAASFRSRDNGIPLEVNRLRALVDLRDGSVIVSAYGHLVNKDGTVGERSRDQYLETEQIPMEAKHIIATEAQFIRQQIAATGTLTGVKFA